MEPVHKCARDPILWSVTNILNQVIFYPVIKHCKNTTHFILFNEVAKCYYKSHHKPMQNK